MSGLKTGIWRLPACVLARGLIVLLVPIAISASCGRSDTEGVAAAGHQGVESFPPVVLTPAALEAYRPLLAEPALGALSDKILTGREYADAVNRAIACAKDAGLQVQGDPQLADGGRTLEWSYVTKPGREERDRSIYQDCYARHQLVLERAWTLPDHQDAGSETKVRDEGAVTGP